MDAINLSKLILILYLSQIFILNSGEHGGVLAKRHSKVKQRQNEQQNQEPPQPVPMPASTEKPKDDTPVPVPSETPAPVPSETPAPVPSETPAPVPSDKPNPAPSHEPKPIDNSTPASKNQVEEGPTTKPYDFITGASAKCADIKRIDRVFRYDDTIIFHDGDGPEMLKVNVGNLSDTVEYIPVSNLTKQLKYIRSAIHFDLIKACSNTESNPRFCRISKLYNQHVVFFGESQSSTKRKFSVEFLNATGFVPEETYEEGSFFWSKHSLRKPDIRENDNPHEGDVLERKIKQVFFTFFINYLSNPVLDFKGITYDHDHDALYTIATVRPKDVAHDMSSWRVGEYVMFRANFSPHGLIQDSFHAAHFTEPKSGIFAHNGRVYVLNHHGDKFAEYYADAATGKVFTLSEMFCDKKSPLMDLVKNKHVPYRNERADEYERNNFVSNLAQFFFPHIPDFVRIMEPPFLQGAAFYTLTFFLALAFVIMCVINIFTVMEDLKIDSKFQRRIISKHSKRRHRRISRKHCGNSSMKSKNSASVSQYSMTELIHRNVHPDGSSQEPDHTVQTVNDQPDIYRSYSKENTNTTIDGTKKYIPLTQADIEKDSSPGNYPEFDQ